MTGDDQGTLNVYLVVNKNFQLKFTKTDDVVSFWTSENIEIDGRQFQPTDMVEVIR